MSTSNSNQYLPPYLVSKRIRSISERRPKKRRQRHPRPKTPRKDIHNPYKQLHIFLDANISLLALPEQIKFQPEKSPIKNKRLQRTQPTKATPRQHQTFLFQTVI